MTSVLPKVKLSHRFKRNASLQLGDGMLFSLSRQVLHSIIGLYGWSDNDHIVMPGSLCEEALKPFLAAGLTIGCYGLNRSLTSDVRSIRNRIQTNTVAIYVVHYFGRKDTNIETIRDLCDQLNILLIEDCALCFPNDVYSGIGSFGDYSFFSLWKYLGVPDGSIVYTRGRAKALKEPSQKANFSRITKRLIGSMLPYSLKKYREDKNQQLYLGDSIHNYSANIELNSSAQMISFISKYILCRSDIEVLAQTRRYHYKFIEEQVLNHSSIRPLWAELDKDWVLYAFPLVTKHPRNLQHFLLNNGIQSELAINDYFPIEGKISAELPDMKSISELAQSVICIPLHQSLSEQELVKIGFCLHAYE